MKLSETTDLQAVLAAHAEWAKDYYGEKGASLSDKRRANLSGADLSGANLSRANLSRANLSGANLSRANLSRANLSGANLSRANLSGANLSRANLSSAYLSGAKIDENASVYDGVTLKEFREQIVPALCTAGGVALEEVAQAWDCHSWSNCPMHVAFGVDDISGIPAPWRSQAKMFVQLFDGGHLPKPEVPHV